ncbi:hypothetical protein DFP72DRAFT_913177, partial [Ephemerocybe angulata]
MSALGTFDSPRPPSSRHVVRSSFPSPPPRLVSIREFGIFLRRPCTHHCTDAYHVYWMSSFVTVTTSRLHPIFLRLVACVGRATRLVSIYRHNESSLLTVSAVHDGGGKASARGVAHGSSLYTGTVPSSPPTSSTRFRVHSGPPNNGWRSRVYGRRL